MEKLSKENTETPKAPKAPVDESYSFYDWCRSTVVNTFVVITLRIVINYIIINGFESVLKILIGSLYLLYSLDTIIWLSLYTILYIVKMYQPTFYNQYLRYSMGYGI